MENIEKEAKKVKGLDSSVMLFRGNVPAPSLAGNEDAPTWDVSVNFIPVLYPGYVPVPYVVPAGILIPPPEGSRPYKAAASL